MKTKKYVIGLLLLAAVAGAAAWGISAVMAKEEIVAMQNLPVVVQNAIEKYADGGKINEIEKGMQNGQVVYEAEVVIDGKEVDVLVSETGEYLGSENDGDDDDSGEMAENRDDDDDSGEMAENGDDDNDSGDIENGDEDEGEQVIGLNDLPESVRAQLKGIKPTEITVDTEDGAVVYEVEYMDNGTKSSISFAPKGDIIENEQAVSVQELPIAVMDKLGRLYPEAMIDEADLVTRTFYEVDLKVGDGSKEVQVMANGQMLGGDDNDGEEVEGDGEGHDDDDDTGENAEDDDE